MDREPRTLHLLKSRPDSRTELAIERMAGKTAVRVVCLYPDEFTGTDVNWDRLVEDIFAHDRIICW